MSIKQLPVLESCIERHIKTGECKCYYKRWETPYKCDVDILICMVCARHHGKRDHEKN